MVRGCHHANIRPFQFLDMRVPHLPVGGQKQEPLAVTKTDDLRIFNATLSTIRGGLVREG